MGKTVKGLALAAGFVALAFVTGGASVVTTLASGSYLFTTAAGSMLLAMGAATALSTVSSALFGPKAPKSQLSRLNISLDPITSRKAVFGTTAMPLDLRYHEASGANQEFIDYIIAVAAHKVTAISEIWFEEKQAWTAAGGVTATYNGFLTVTTRTEGTAGNTIAINGGGKWGSSRRLTGCAYVHLRIKRTGATSKTQSPLVNGLPSRITIIGNGALLYDPRKDSTIPGGSGTHRASDQTTWGVYTDADDCDNPALQLLWWLLGWKINGKLSIGCGVPANRIDIASFITAANICDENVTLAIGGTQKRYRTSGTAADSDSRMDIINTFLTSMNGTLRDSGGKLTLTLMKNDLASYALDLSENDMLGDFEWQQTRGLTESYNVIRGRYIDPSVNSLYQPVDYPEVSIASADGIERATTIDLMYVEDGRRAQRIAKQILQRNQYRGMFSATFNTKALGCQVGDVVRLTVSSMGWTNKLFRVVSQEIRFDGQVPLALVEENAAIYAWSNEDQAPVVPTAPTVYNPLNDPFILGLADAQAIADGKIDSYYQTEPPTGATEGDYWTDTNDANKLYRYTSGAWVSIQDGGIPAAISAAAGAQATANGKVTTYYSETTPTATAIGDLWYKPSTGFVQRWNGSAWADVATLGATIGENVKDKAGNPVAIEAIRNNLALIDWWKKGATIPWSPNAEFNSIISVPADAVTVQPPTAGQADVWFCEEVTGNGEQGGGWNAAPIAFLNPDKAYRFVLPIRRVAGTGQAYWGINGVANVNTTTLNTNPYFAAMTLPNLDRWYLFVGYIFPRNSTGKNGDNAGIWDCKTGLKVQGGANYCFLPDGTQPTHRAYQYYASLGAQQMFGMPLIEPIESMSDMTLYFEEAARLNNAIGVNGSGQFVNPVGTGNGTTIANSQITVDGSGQLAGIGTGNNTVVANNQINITSGNLNGIGTGNGTEVENSRLDLAFDTSGTAGRARAQLRRNGGATVNNTVQLPSVLQNKDITINSGAISGIGTGDGAVIGNDQIQIDANGNFINAVGAGNGTSIANSLVANRLISRGSVATIIEGNTIRRSSGNSDYNAFVSGDPVSGACFAEAVIAGGGYTMIAFDTAAGSGYYGDQDFVIHASPSAGTAIYRNGTYIGSVGSVTAGHLLRIVYDGERFQVFVNGVQVGVDYAAPAGQTLFPIFNAYNGPGSYTGLNYGPYAINSAETRFVVQTSSGPTLRLVGSNAVIRDGAGSWDSQCYSERGYEGGAYCSFTPTASSCYFMAGLNSDPTTNASYLSIDYAFYMAGDANIYIYESGNGVGTFGTWAAGTVLSVVYDNEYVRYLINGEEVRCVRATASRTFHFDSSVVQGAAITNIRFGPVTPDASNVDFIHDNNQQSQRGNSVYKNKNANIDWDTKSVSRQLQTGTAFVSGKLSTVNTFLGLKKASDVGSNWGAFQATFHRSSNGSWYTWSYGSPRINMGSAYLGVTFDDNTEFRITYDGVKLRWYANNTLVDETSIEPGITYTAAVSIYGRGDRVDNIQFGPYTDNAWVSVGGANRPEDNATVGATAGTNLRRSNATVLNDNDIITSLGTAANIANQAATATNSDFSAVTGTTKPENNATVGARAGTNLRRSNNTVVGDAEVLNENQQWNQVNSRPLLITGDYITADELLLDPSVWIGIPSNWFYVDTDGTGFIETPSGSGTTLMPKFANATPIDHSATYEAEWEILEVGSGAPISAYYTVVYCWDASGNVIGQDGTYWYYPSSFQQNIGRGSYERRLARFGKGTARPFPEAAVKFGVGLLPNYNNAAVVTRARRIRARRIEAENLGINGDASRWQLANNTAIRWSGGSGWGITTARSKSALVGAQSLSFDAVASPSMCGFTDVANPGSYNDIDYAWYYADGGALQIYENGNYVWGTSGYTNPDDVRLRIEYDGNIVSYYVNGNFARSVIAGAGRSFRVAVDNFRNFSGVRNINHVSTESKAYVGVNTYNSTGGAWSAENGATVGATAGTNLRRSNATVLGDNDIITSLGTAANIANQAATATNSDFSAVTGTTKPENNATVGATAGTNLRRSNATVLNDGDIITSLGTAANINNQGALATRNNTRLGNEVVDESGNAIAAEFIRNNVNRGSLGTIAYPSGGSFAAEVNGLTGAIQIMLPNTFADGRYTMIKFQVDIYNYLTETSLTYDISGYVYPILAAPTWYNMTAKVVGGGIGSVRPVRFGRTGSASTDKFCVWIGDTNSVWYYPKVQVRNVMTGYSSIDVAFWQSGWAVSTVTAFGTIDASILNPTAGDAVFGINALETWNGAVATLPNFKTSQGTAAAIVNQGTGATANTLAQLDATAAAQLSSAVNGAAQSVARSATIEKVLNNNASVSIDAASAIFSSGGGATYTLQLKIREVGGTDINVGTAASVFIAASESDYLQVSGTYTNTSGGTRRYQITCALTKVGAGTAVETQSQSYLRA